MLFLITWLYETLHKYNKLATKWHRIIICYENMCQLVRMWVSREPLLLSKPFDKMWPKITKCIDTLHVRNHVMERCKTELHSDQIGEINPKIHRQENKHLCTYPDIGAQGHVFHDQISQLFLYVYRLYIRRNEYIAKCNQIVKNLSRMLSWP